MSGISRVSIPQKLHETIQSIKEIAGNHSDEEIYAMLKECSMDPNETAQKLLHQDTFHEVRRKRDKRKENLNNRETTDSRWRPGAQGRGGRAGRGNYSSRYNSHDASGGRNASTGKENGVNQRPESGVTVTPSLAATQEAENKGMAPVPSSISGMANGLNKVGNSTHGRTYCPEKPADVDVSKLGSELPAPPPPVEAKISSSSGVNITHGKITPSSDHSASPVSVLGVYSSASDPVLVPSLDSRLQVPVGTIKREVGSQRTGLEPNSLIPAETKSAATQDYTKRLQSNKVVSRNVTTSELTSPMNEKAAPEIGNSFMHGNVSGRPQGFENSQVSEALQPASSSSHGGSTSRPSSNYGSRSQQLVGSQKAVGPSKEWKPKPANQNSAAASGTVVVSEVGSITDEAGSCSVPKLNASVSEEANSKLQHKLEELHLSHGQHVIIPNHLQVPVAERSGLSFGSFDASFALNTSYANGPETDKSSTAQSESSQVVEEAAEEPCSSNQLASPNAQEGDYPDQPESPRNAPENSSPVEADVPSSASPEFDQSKSEGVLPAGGPQYSVVHTAPNYSFGLMPPVLGTQFAPFDSSEPQARDVSRLQSFVVPQFDPSTSYYTQFFRPSADGDGRFSPFLAPGAAPKYNGNVAVLPSQSGQPSQESGNSLVLSTAGPTPLVTQAAGVMQSSLAVSQQPVPVFRQPSGVHLPHYPPNYIPYSQYFSPVYVPSIHHFLGNTAFPQQAPAGNIYPPPTAAAAPGVKFSLPQYKPGTNTGNSTHVGTPTGYPPYNSSPAGYSPSPAVTAGNSTGSEDLSASQFKESNVYMTGQQSEGSTVWIPGREVSGLQANSFYNISPQGQHVTYAPTQAGHGPFAGIYHPAQTMSAGTVHPLLQQSQTMAGPVEMVGPPAGLYQQPQRAQINWTNNY